MTETAAAHSRFVLSTLLDDAKERGLPPTDTLRSLIAFGGNDEMGKITTAELRHAESLALLTTWAAT